MDDLYGNAWGDPVNDYPPNPTHPLPTWNAHPPSPKLTPPAEVDQNENHANDDENKKHMTEAQFRTDAPDTSWTTDAVPWSAGENQNPYYPAWEPAPPANVWNSTAEPQTPEVPALTPSDDAPPKPVSPAVAEETKEGHPVSSEQEQVAHIQSRAPSPDQFGTFESGNTDPTVPVEGAGWGSPKYSTLDDSVDSSDAWGQQAATKERDPETEPADEWEAARRVKERVDRRVVGTLSWSLI
jgi:hypothetical protein